jgi:hypothetical protein
MIEPLDCYIVLRSSVPQTIHRRFYWGRSLSEEELWGCQKWRSAEDYQDDFQPTAPKREYLKHFLAYCSQISEPFEVLPFLDQPPLTLAYQCS